MASAVDVDPRVFVQGITRKNVIDPWWKHPQQLASQRRVNDRLAMPSVILRISPAFEGWFVGPRTHNFRAVEIRSGKAGLR